MDERMKKTLEIKINGLFDAREILKQAGYCRNRNKCGSFWLDKQGKEYEFMGWGPSEDGMMPRKPQYIESQEVI